MPWIETCIVSFRRPGIGIPVGTVKSRVYYAVRALRLVLAEREVSL